MKKIKHIKNIVWLIPLIILVYSCKDETNNKESYFFSFKPRKAAYVSIIPGAKTFLEYEGIKLVEYNRDIEDNKVSKDLLYLTVNTSNFDVNIFKDKELPWDTAIYYRDKYLSEHIPTLEQQIVFDYKKQTEKNSRSSGKGGEFGFPINIEYRTTAIKNMTISALNASLFGQSAGESLNDFFDIVSYVPPVIASYPSNMLLYGYSSKDYPVSIDEWLSLSPLAQSSMQLAPNKEIEGIPLDVQFVVTMETVEGVILSDTTQVFSITQ